MPPVVAREEVSERWLTHSASFLNGDLTPLLDRATRMGDKRALGSQSGPLGDRRDATPELCEFLVDNLPDDFEIDREVPGDDPVTRARGLLPRNLRMRGAGRGRDGANDGRANGSTGLRQALSR